METNSDAKQQLDRLARDREVVAERIRSPWWVHAAYGVLVVLLALGRAYLPEDRANVLYAGFVVAWLALTSWQGRRWGVGFRARGNPTTWLWGLLMLVFAMGAIVVALGAQALGQDLIAWLSVLAAGVGVSLISLGLERGLRARARGEA